MRSSKITVQVKINCKEWKHLDFFTSGNEELDNLQRIHGNNCDVTISEVD